MCVGVRMVREYRVMRCRRRELRGEREEGIAEIGWKDLRDTCRTV
jgi:hypothetical protein